MKEALQPRVKYPRTFHMPFSPGVQSDDKIIKTTSQFEGRRVILTEKMDGENTSMYRDGIHARSLDSAHHESRDWVKRIWSEISCNIPENFRICGENMYAKHSIAYNDLRSYFYAFSVWDGTLCLSWDETIMWTELLEIPVVPVLYDGLYDEDKIQSICQNLDQDKIEGAVLRIADQFNYIQFGDFVMKYVRKGHVQTDIHWMHQKIEPNKLA